MKFGLSFFPTVGPQDKDAATHYAECLQLVTLAEELGYDHVKAVEHYFFTYGGYSPDPVTFLAAAAARTSRVRLVTGAVLPAFTHPIKLAAKLAMLDNISGGRLDAGFGRAFLPDEFSWFQVPIDESRARFDEGVEACRRLWAEEDVHWQGTYHQFGPVTLLPRPFRQPGPPILVAAALTPSSCEAAGRNGYGLMLVPAINPREKVQDMLGLYRKAWAEAGHEPGGEVVQLSYNCYLSEDPDEALVRGEECSLRMNHAMRDAVAAWGRTRSEHYVGYENIVKKIAQHDFHGAVADKKLLVGTPEQVTDQLRTIREWFGDVTISLQAITGNPTYDEAVRTVRLFGEQVAPRLADGVSAGTVGA